MPKFAQHFLESSDKFHQEYGSSIVEIDFDEYTKNPHNRDETGRAIHIYTTYENSTKRTKKLHIQSVIPSEAEKYQDALWGSEEMMMFYGNGKAKEPGYAAAGLKTWYDRLALERNPYSGLSIYTIDDDFVGNVMLGKGAKLNYMIVKSQQGNGYGTVAVGNVVFNLTTHLVNDGYRLPDGTDHITTYATAHPENKASKRILEKLGFELKTQGVEPNFGLRDFYEMDVVKPIGEEGYC